MASGRSEHVHATGRARILPMTAAINVFAEQTQTGRDLPGDPWMMGVGAFALLVVLLLITLSFGKDR